MMGAARWIVVALAAVARCDTACHSPKTSTSYVHEPPVASFRRPALAEVVTTMAVVGVWGGDDEASLAAFLGSLGAALPRATVSVVAARGDVAAAARVAARFPSQAARVVEAAGDAWRAGARLLGGSGAALLTDADGVSFQSAALRDTVAGASGCAAFDAGGTRSLLGAGDAVRERALGGGPYLDWSRHSWGYDCDPAYETYDSLPPVNLGVVLGDPPSVLAALERLVCDLEACGGWDQFVFSKLVYTTVSPRVYTTDDGPVADPRRAAPTFRVTRRPPPAQVANLCSNLEARVGDAGAVLNADGRPYALVHQWDRYDAVAAHVAARYPYVAAWGP